MSDFVRIPPDSTGKKMDAKQHPSQGLFTQGVHISSSDDPTKKQIVDKEGAAFFRFAEGSPQFDGFGKMRVSNHKALGEYIFQYCDEGRCWWEDISGTAETIHSPNDSGLRFITGTNAGDRVTRTSHKYHKYSAGNSQLIMMTLTIGDNGKSGVVREWGYSDVRDGVFFYLDEYELYCAIRSSTTGTVVETKIPQSLWNGDKLDGTGLSGMSLNLDKDNIYWFDFQWLGAGRVRFGVVAENGTRVVAHSFENANLNDRPYMRSGTLPVRFEQYNKTAVTSQSEMKAFCIAVKTEGELEPTSRPYSYSSQKTLTAGKNHIMSLACSELFNNSDNHWTILPYDLGVYASNAVKIELVLAGTLSAGTWSEAAQSDTMSASIIDISDSVVSGGRVIKTLYATGEVEKDLSETFDYVTAESIRRYADGTIGQFLSVVVTPMTESTTVVDLSINWHEIY